MEIVEQGDETKLPLDLATTLQQFLQDIPTTKLRFPVHRAATEWETVAIIARTASLSGHCDLPVEPTENYLPQNRDQAWLNTFQKEIETGNIMSICNQLKNKKLIFRV